MRSRLFLPVMMVAIATTAGGQVFTETISRELTFEKKDKSNTLMLFNINGSVSLEGYAGDKILVEVKKTIRAKTDTRIEEGKQEIQLGVMDRADTIILYVNGACSTFGRQDRDRNWRSKYKGWGYDWNKSRKSCESRYDYSMEFKIKVPSTINLVVSTINGGDLEITNSTGSVVADNVNGGIRLSQISGSTNASCINGEVNLDFSGNPPGDSRFYSLNGDITANFRKGLAAQLAFKSFNGDFYTSLTDVTPMAVQLEKTDKGGEGTRYRVSGNRYKVRQGGPLLDFETFNGDVILKEKEN